MTVKWSKCALYSNTGIFESLSVCLKLQNLAVYFFIISPVSFYLQLQDWKCVLDVNSISCRKLLCEKI